MIQTQELPAGEIARHFEVSRSAISQHLKILEEADLVTVRQAGTSRFYRANPDGLEELRNFLEGFWSSRLLNLKREAEAAEKKTTDQERDKVP